MNLKFWEIGLPLIFWGIVIPLIVSAVFGFIVGVRQTVADVRDHDIREAAESMAATALFGAIATLVALLIHDVVVFT